MRGALRCPVSQDAVDGENDDPADEDDDRYGIAHGAVHPEQPSEQGDGYQHERLEPELPEVLILEIAHRLGFLLVESHTHFISLIASPPGVPVMNLATFPARSRNSAHSSRPPIGYHLSGVAVPVEDQMVQFYVRRGPCP